MLTNPTNYPQTQTQLKDVKDVQDAARAAARPIHVLQASAERELETAFAALGQLKPGALLVASDPWLSTRRDQLIELSRATPFQRCTNGGSSRTPGG